MKERERLIELIKQATISYLDYLESIDQKGLTDTEGKAKFIADHLLANGVIVPPCKVGDTVYVLTSDSRTGIEKSRVKRMLLQELKDGTTIRITVPCVYDDWGGAFRTFYPNDFGKTVFLSREEAEKALAERSKG